MEFINLVPASVQCSNQSHPPQCPFVYFHPSTLLGSCGLDSAEVPLLPPGPALPALGELRQPVFPAAADFQLISVRAWLAWGALNTQQPILLKLPTK